MLPTQVLLVGQLPQPNSPGQPSPELDSEPVEELLSPTLPMCRS